MSYLAMGHEYAIMMTIPANLKGSEAAENDQTRGV